MNAAPATARPTIDSNTVTPAEFEAGVLAFAGRLRAFIRRRVRDATDAEDLAQDIFVKVFRARGTLRDPRRLEAWIYQTARTAIVDYYRRRRPTEELPASLSGEPAAFDEVGEAMRRSVRALVATLPEHYRRPLMLADFQGMSVAAIARKLGLGESATKSRLTRGRALVRRRLHECCRFEFDPFGKVIDMHGRQACACACEPDASPRDRVCRAPARR